jgi:hypothetical protein
MANRSFLLLLRLAAQLARELVLVGNVASIGPDAD